MNLTKAWIKKHSPCTEGIDWLNNQEEKKGIDVVKKLIAENRLDWANWLVVRLLNRQQRIAYAIFAAEQVIQLFETKYPNDKRPRLAIEATKTVLKKDTKENIEAANAAARAANVAANVAYAAAHAADAATCAAYTATNIAYAAARAAYEVAYAAAYAADNAAYAAAYAAYASYAAVNAADYAVYAAVNAAVNAAYAAMKTKIILYGVRMLEGK